MNYEDFQEIYNEDRHSLSDLIRQGEIPFDLCLEAHGRMGLPILLQSSMLVHPDCDKIFFKINFKTINSKGGAIVRKLVLPTAPILRELECIQTVINSKEATVEDILSYWFDGNKDFDLLFTNPHIPKELKDRAYELTGNEKLLPKEAQDIFLF